MVQAGGIETKCAKCGGPLSSGRAGNVCPRCLLGAAMTMTANVMETSSSASTAPARPAPLRMGNYELLGEIARGGMGVVYKARQAGLNRLVAVKVVAAGQFASNESLERFRIEAEAAARLSHPNIVAIYEVGQSDGREFFSMELVEGDSLDRWIKKHPLSSDGIAELTKKISEATHFAHQRGVLHRDLKPQNILMDEDGNPHVADFGLAKQSENDSTLTVTGVVFGTPGYAAPEQASGRHDRVGPASDVFSVGAILYFLLTDAAPHAAATAIEAFRKTLEEPPVPPSRLRATVPRDLETICLKCLEKEPDRRYPSARALAEDIDRFLSRLPLQARRAGPFWHLWALVRSRPWAVTGLASLLQLAMIGLAYGLWQRTKFLEWQIVHPDRPPPFHVLLIFSPGVASLLIYTCMLGGYLPLKDLRARLAEGRAFERNDVLKFCITGACFGFLGVLLLLRCTKGFVWHYGDVWRWPWLALLPSFSFFWFGSIIVLKTLRGHYGGQHSADVLVAQRGSPIGVAPWKFLAALLVPISALEPVAWLWQGPDRASAFAFLVTDVFLLTFALRFARAMRDEMRPFWQFLVIAMSGLTLELAMTLARIPAVTAIVLGIVVGLAVIRRVRISART